MSAELEDAERLLSRAAVGPAFIRVGVLLAAEDAMTDQARAALRTMVRDRMSAADPQALALHLGAKTQQLARVVDPRPKRKTPPGARRGGRGLLAIG